MFLSTYFVLYRTQLNQQDALKASAAFGLVSNPFWLLLLTK